MKRAGLAIILAAGAGVRLAPTGHTLPKGFIRLGAMPIVEESVLRLADAGIGRVLIVTGHQAVHYEALAARHAGLVALVHNERYADRGSAESLAVAARHVTEDVLVLESDIVYEPRALDAILGHAGTDVLLVSGLTRAGDECFVEASDDHMLIDISKDRAALGPHVIGEMVGITRLSRGGLDVVLEEARRMAARGRAVAYEDALAAAARRVAVHCALVPDLVWAEIDDAHHLERARRDVYPAIAGDREPRSTAGAA